MTPVPATRATTPASMSYRPAVTSSWATTVTTRWTAAGPGPMAAWTWYQGPGGLPEPGQRRRLRGNRRLRAGLPEGEGLGVEGFQDVAHRRRGGQGVAEQRRQGVILAERREVLAPVPARDPEGDQTLHELGRSQAALP